MSARKPILAGPRQWVTLPAMTLDVLPIPLEADEIARFCRDCGIRRLALFGSVLRAVELIGEAATRLPVELRPLPHA